MRQKKFCMILFMITALLFTASCKNTAPEEDGNDDVIVRQDFENSINLAIDSVDTLNPLFTKSESVADCMQLIFEPLFAFDESMNPVGVLADSCIASEDGLRYTIKIKQGVQWHDSAPLTAADVLHTINLIRYNDSRFSSSLECFSSVTMADNETVVVKLSKRVPNFTALLSFPIVQNSLLTEPGKDYVPCGTGPFKYDQKVTSDKLRLVTNQNYHSAPPAINEVYLNVLKDANAAVNAFNASEIDMITSELMDLKQNTPRGEIYTSDYVSNKFVFLGINNEKAQFMSSNTRRVLSYLTDRQNIVTTEVFSRAVESSLPINPSAWYAPKNGNVTNDLQYMTELLSLDGWAAEENGGFERSREQYRDGFDEPQTIRERLTADILVNEDNEERIRIAAKIAEAFNKFGIKTTVTSVNFEDYTRRINEKDYSLFIGEVELPKNMDVSFLMSGSDNYFSYSSQDMDDVLYAVACAGSTEEQAAAYSEFSNVFSQEMPFVPLFFRKESVIFENSIAGTSSPTIFTAYRNPQNWYISRNKAVSTQEPEQEAKK